MHRLTLTKVGEATAVVLPEEVLARLGWRPGELVYLDDMADGVLLSSYDAHTRAQLGAGREFVRDHGAALRVLGE